MQEQLTPDFGDYELLDTGDFEKLERFGRYVTQAFRGGGCNGSRRMEW